MSEASSIMEKGILFALRPYPNSFFDGVIGKISTHFCGGKVILRNSTVYREIREKFDDLRKRGFIMRGGIYRTYSVDENAIISDFPENERERLRIILLSRLM
jgi:hypothetical protein